MKLAAIPISAIDSTRPNTQDVRVFARCTRHCQHVVERHRHVGDHDLPRRLGKRLARRIRPAIVPSALMSTIGQRLGGFDLLVRARRFAIRATSSSTPTAAERRRRAAALRSAEAAW